MNMLMGLLVCVSLAAQQELSPADKLAAMFTRAFTWQEKEPILLEPFADLLEQAVKKNRYLNVAAARTVVNGKPVEKYYDADTLAKYFLTRARQFYTMEDIFKDPLNQQTFTDITVYSYRPQTKKFIFKRQYEYHDVFRYLFEQFETKDTSVVQLLSFCTYCMNLALNSQRAYYKNTQAYPSGFMDKATNYLTVAQDLLPRIEYMPATPNEKQESYISLMELHAFRLPENLRDFKMVEQYARKVEDAEREKPGSRKSIFTQGAKAILAYIYGLGGHGVEQDLLKAYNLAVSVKDKMPPITHEQEDLVNITLADIYSQFRLLPTQLQGRIRFMNIMSISYLRRWRAHDLAELVLNNTRYLPAINERARNILARL